ncbi:MAG: response regulator transcription factor [Desulfobacteraceae bacterium]|nr:response regulator transcription factor [Desulfobacteraceae bacterium]
MIKILIADDHAIVRAGLKQIIEGIPDMVLADEAANGWELLEKVRKNEFDVIVLDITMPGGGGMEVLKQLRIEKPKLPVLALSIHPEDQYGKRMLKAGAAGYLSKESAPEELVNAIRKVYSGGRYISANLAEKLAADLARRSDAPLHEELSDREYQVMVLIGSGKMITEIASELNLSVKTVSTYRTRILEKMMMKTNAELTHYVVTHQLSI